MIIFLRVLTAEIRQEMWRMRAYYVEFLGVQALFVFGFLLLSGLFQIVSEGQYDDRARLVSLVGFLAWQVADGCLIRTADSFAEDARWGTLEQVWLSAVSPGLIVIARSITVLLVYTVRASLNALILGPILGLWPTPSLAILVTFLLAQMGVFGTAFIIVGTHLVYKSVTSVTLVLSTALLFVTGALVPLHTAPWLQSLGRLLPLGAGMGLLQELASEGIPLATLLARPDFHWLMVHSALYGLLGWAVLSWGQRVARLRGNLAHY